jgi:hypothetical protein
VAGLELHGREIHLKAAAERYLIRYIPKDRTTVLQRLAEAREELAAFEASLQAKRDRSPSWNVTPSGMTTFSVSAMICPGQTKAATASATELQTSAFPSPVTRLPMLTGSAWSTAAQGTSAQCFRKTKSCRL